MEAYICSELAYIQVNPNKRSELSEFSTKKRLLEMSYLMALQVNQLNENLEELEV